MAPHPKKKPTASTRLATSRSRLPNTTTASTSKTNILNTLERPIPNPPDPTEHGLSEDIPEVVRSLPYVGKRSTRALLARGLPPMSSLNGIYDDMTGRAMDLGFDRVLEHLGEKPLRVVTVCSGTESPLLALEMVQKSMDPTVNRYIWMSAYLYNSPQGEVCQRVQCRTPLQCGDRAF